MKGFAELEKMLDDKQFKLLHDEFVDDNPADIAGLLEAVPIEKAVLLFRMLPKDAAAEVFANLFSDVQQALIGQLSDKEIFNVIEELFLDDATDFIE
ncbi:MAG: magnesium transporter, partial [Oscillospiraceae bacterium]|nr:magnesium transporter [Oscillospiraceae bacterium]